MFKTLLICAVVSASLIACSTTAPPRTAATATAQPCSADTGSRITLRPGQCSTTPVRTYSNKDIERTGQTDLADALQMLDPSISAHH